jgi:hypothetical protein
MSEKEISKEEQQVKELLDATAEQIDRIDQIIKNLPPDKGPVPALKPKGLLPQRPVTREQKIASYKRQQRNLNADADKKIKALIRKSPPEIKAAVQKLVLDMRDPDIIRAKKIAKEKELSESQDIAKELLEINRPLDKKIKDEKDIDKSQEVAQEIIKNHKSKQEEKPAKEFSMSARFMMTLEHAEIPAEKDNKDIGKNKVKDKEENNDKFSMSKKFSENSEFTKSLPIERDNIETRNDKKEDIDLDKD